MKRAPVLLRSMAAALLLAGSPALRAGSVRVDLPAEPAPSVAYGAGRLTEALRAVRESAVALPGGTVRPGDIVVGTPADPAVHDLPFRRAVRLAPGQPGREGFVLASCEHGETAVIGGDATGAFYGCLELAARIRRSGGLPRSLHFSDRPVFATRGVCFGLQKTYRLPGRGDYEYPVTPELFPYFYDRTYWREYLDFLAENRYDRLYLWSGHPFASFVRVGAYPNAVEVSDAVLARNQAMLHYILNEADRRGIRVYVQFYSILVSKPFAAAHGIPTQLRAPTALVADYTRKSIAAFVKEYPRVRLMVCLGEALQGLDHQIYWMDRVILPGIEDGLREAGVRERPPVALRAHAIWGGIEGATALLKSARRIYPEIETIEKYNGESLTTAEPRGPWRAENLALSRLAMRHIVNIHILANLEPFRYGDQEFIRRCVIAARDRMGASGLHVYPLSYWNWPDAPDATHPPLQQWRRDWIWFEAWARYGWNPDVDPAADRAFWIERIAEHYGPAAAPLILDAYDASGECAPRLIRRFGITEGNRQTLSLGMTLDELVDPAKYHAEPDLWESQAPPGERLQEYADREWKHQPHHGETPPDVIRAVLADSAEAVGAIDRAAPLVTRNGAEFERLRNDVHCIRALCLNYSAKANAALLVLRYDHSHDPADLVRAEAFLAASLQAFRELVRLTANRYLYANSMQTSHRRIPVPGAAHGVPAFYRWNQMLPIYERELADFQRRVADARGGRP